MKAVTRIVEYEYKLLNQTQIYRGKFPAIHLKKRFDNSARKSKKKKKKKKSKNVQKKKKFFLNSERKKKKKKKSCKLVHREKYFT